ncbi:MAG: flagellum biosynthesis protein FlbT [Rhodospirillaceae bacterium]|nr:flagellum biosynthesis protein FlbT [Magnetovibrio sp.]MAY67801.1 flagellum biosynthesis protein FlbT [Rhodospirillaceae bacterium]|tara:strand:- start:516 stop:962 length:447 start_codon:yes stop_codon:yes gene_type:complete
MPLKLDVKAGEKLVINGAVLENVGGNAKLLIHNDSAIIREKEILSQSETNTPAARVYFALQCAYMFPRHEDEYLKTFRGFLDDYLAAAPSAREIGEEIIKFVDEAKLYRALKATQKLIRHEADMFTQLADQIQATELADRLEDANPET